MVRRITLVGVAAAVLPAFAAAAAPNMYLVQADHDTMTVADRGTMVQVAPTIRRVHVHTFYSQPLQADGASIQHLERVKEFDCATGMDRTIAVSFFGPGDRLVQSHVVDDDHGAAWARIEPDSNERLDERSICRPPVAARHLDYENGQKMYADYLDTVIQHGGR